MVPPGYGWLSGGVRIHGVDDGLPLPFLVNLPKAATGLSVRGLPLKVLLIFIHIVHLETTGRKEVTGRGEWLSPSAFPPISKPDILRKKRTYQKPHPALLQLPFLHYPSLSLHKNRSARRLCRAHLRQRVLTKKKKKQQKCRDKWGIRSEGELEECRENWKVQQKKQMEILYSFWPIKK